MITCERCKTENLDGSQYCDECGAPLRPNGRQTPVQNDRRREEKAVTAITLRRQARIPSTQVVVFPPA